jgi:hypothetical protein
MSTKFAALGMAVETPSRMVILHPVTRRPLCNAETGAEAWIELLSEASAPGRAHDRDRTDRMLKMKGRKLSPEEIETDMVDKLAAVTKAWSLFSLDGIPLEIDCTAAEARALYAMPEARWLRDQVSEFATDVGNFRPAASTS